MDRLFPLPFGSDLAAEIAAAVLPELPVAFSPGPLLGVLFAEDFDGEPHTADDLPAPGPEPEPPPPAFGEADLEAARRDGYAAGFADAEARASIARGLDRVAALEAVGASLGTTAGAAVALVEQAASSTAALMLQMLCRLLPALSAAHGEQEVRMLTRTLLPALSREAHATIRVHPQHLDGVREELAGLDPAQSARIALHPAAGMAPGDARVTWECGSARREAAAIRATMEAALAGLGLISMAAPANGTVADGIVPGAPGSESWATQNAGRELEHVG